MAKEVSFLDAATKRGVTNIAQQGAQALGTLANAIAKQKTKEDKAAKEQLNQIQKMITPPKDMDKLVKIPAAQNYTGTISKMYNAYASGDPNWQTKSLEAFSQFTEDIATKQSFSDNYKAFNEARRNSKVFVPKAYKTLGEYYDGSDNIEQYFEKIKADPKVQNLVSPENLHVNQTSFKPAIPIQSYISNIYNDIEPIQLGKEKETVIVLTEDEAKNIQKLTGTKPNSIEAASERLMNDFDFLEQYIDAKDLDIDYMNIGAPEREKIKKSLINDGKEYVMKKYPGKGITVITGDATKDTPAGFNKTIAFAQYEVSVGGKNETRQAPLLGNFKPLEEPSITLSTYKGTLDRQGQPTTNTKNALKKFTGMAVIPYKIENGKEKGVFSPNASDLQSATGFQVYYQFEGGDIYVPVSQIPNLQLNVGSKEAVASQRYALIEQQKFAKELNEYQKKVKAGTIKNPVLYKKMEELSKGLITNEEMNTFISTFKYDK